MRCACGYNQFVNRVHTTVEQESSRWFLLSEGEAGGGLGYVPLGAAGMAGAKLYGRVEVDVYLGELETACKACGRVRHTREVGGGVPIATWKTGRDFYLAMASVVDPSCARIQLRGQGRAFEYALEVVDTRIPQGTIVPVETATELPYGAVIGETVYHALLPDDLSAGEYRVLLVDRCLRITRYITSITF